MVQVLVKKSAQKSLERIDQRYRRRILDALAVLQSDPLLGTALKGELEGFHSLRVWPYRIIYTVYKDNLVVFVIAIEHRQSVYQ